MATEIIMPKAGMAMEEGTILRWLKEVGDVVEPGEGIMEIETDKITMEIEASVGGVLLVKYNNDGDVVPVTNVVGYIGKAGEEVPSAPATADVEAPSVDAAPSVTPSASEPVPASVSAAAPSAAPASAPVGEPKTSRILATPYAKKLAEQNGVNLSNIAGSGADGVIKARDIDKAVKATPLASRMAANQGLDLSTVAGTGFNGKVTVADLQATTASAVSAPAIATSTVAAPSAADRLSQLSGMRSVIARRMMQSHLEIPPVTQTMKANVDSLVALRASINKSRQDSDRITINDLIIKASAKALSEFPLFRTEFDTQTNQLITRAASNIGFAVALDSGLIVPVIKNADTMTLSSISALAKDLIARAKTGKLQPDEYSGSTFTISNMGTFDVFTFTPIINQPNAAILGVGCINDELYLADGQVSSRKFIMLSLTFDHRIVDGVGAAVFQRRIKELLEKPIEIFI